VSTKLGEHQGLSETVYALEQTLLCLSAFDWGVFWWGVEGLRQFNCGGLKEGV